MVKKTFKRIKPFIILTAYIIACISGFNFLIVQQESILRKYFIVNSQERINKYNAALSDSLSKYFIRENKNSKLEGAADYIKRYGKTSLFEMIFIYRDESGKIKQLTKSGMSTVTKEIFATEKIYPVTIDNGNIPGYLLIVIKEAGTAELEEGLKKYRVISYSLRFLFTLLTVALLVIAFYHTYSAKIKLARDIAEIRASNDGLTGLHTHAYFMKILEGEVGKFKIYNTPIALLMLDIDHFKTFNDRFGHLAGDKVLQEVAKMIKANTRAIDILARYGGEEFAVAIPYVTRSDEGLDRKKRFRMFVREIRTVAERIRKSIELNKVEYLSSTLGVTISIGIAFYYKEYGNATTSHYLVHKADSALYKAKRLGRNRICMDYESKKVISDEIK